MKWLNTYWVPVLLNAIACLFLIGVFGSFLPTNLVELQTTADYTTAMMIVGFVMWGVWNGIKVMLFVIDFYKSPKGFPSHRYRKRKRPLLRLFVRRVGRKLRRDVTCQSRH